MDVLNFDLINDGGHVFVDRPVVSLIKSRNVKVQVKAAAALESLADFNAKSQKVFLDLDAPKHLMRLLKVSARLYMAVSTSFAFLVFDFSLF